MNSDDFSILEYSVLAENCHLKGEFSFTGDVNICSTLNGKIELHDGGKLTVEEKGSIQGEIYAEDIIIKGTINGNIHSSGKVILKSSAQVTGQVKAENLIVYPGAKLQIQVEAENGPIQL